MKKQNNFLKLKGGSEMVLSLRRGRIIKNLKKYKEKFFCRKNKGRKREMTEYDDM